MDNGDVGNGNRNATEAPGEVGAEQAVKKETKKERFDRLAEGRKLAALHAIHLIGNLADRRHYQYKPSEVAKLLMEVRTALDKAEEQFSKALKVEGLKLPRTRK